MRPQDVTIVVLGAGINGAAIARECALSGVSVVVADAADVASGATSWSTRLVHGGLRYLEYGEIDLVRESLAERDRLIRVAPHLIKPLKFLLPLKRSRGGLLASAARIVGFEKLAKSLQGDGGRGAWAVRAGLSLYDILSTDSKWPRHSVVRDLAHWPGIDRSIFPIAMSYVDAQMVAPERFTIELLSDARSACASHGSRFELWTHHLARLEGNRVILEPTASLGIQSRSQRKEVRGCSHQRYRSVGRSYTRNFAAPEPVAHWWNEGEPSGTPFSGVIRSLARLRNLCRGPRRSTSVRASLSERAYTGWHDRCALLWRSHGSQGR